MTIGLGMLATDGVVLAADTQVGMPEYLKMGRGKIAFGLKRPAAKPEDVSALAVTGSGNVHYLDHLQRDFVNDQPHIHTLHERASVRMQDFFRDHILPFSGYGQHERPDVSLILAASHGSKRVLLYTDKNVVNETHDCCAVGAGALYASILLGRLFSRMGATSAMLLAAYVVFQVKECIDGCGNDTDIICLQADGVHYFDREKVKAFEDLFRSYSLLESHLIHYVFNGRKEPTQTARSVSLDIRKLRNKTVRLLQSSKPIKWESSQT